MNNRISFQDFFNPKNIFQSNLPTFVQKKIKNDITGKFLEKPETIGTRLDFKKEIDKQKINLDIQKANLKLSLDYANKQYLLNQRRLQELKKNSIPAVDMDMEEEEEKPVEEIKKKLKLNKLTR